MKILVLGDYENVYANSKGADRLKARGCDIVTVTTPAPQEEIINLGEEAEVIVIVRERAPLNENIINQLPNLKLVSQTGKGVAHLDTDALQRRHIALTTTSGESGPSVTELTIGLMISTARQFSLHQSNLQNEHWNQLPGTELRGKQLGILGLGTIGRQVASIAVALGMKVKAFRPTQAATAEEEGVTTGSLQEVLQTSDVVSLHMRYDAEWETFLDEPTLSLMKKDAIFINTSRGKFVDEQALAALLYSHHLLGAGIDVFTEEPLKNNPYKHCDNVILTPHIGYITAEVLQRFAEAAFENVWNHFFEEKKK